LKFIFLIGIIVSLFWVPDAAMEGYGDFARFASCIYLVLQCMMIVDWGYSTNDCLFKKAGGSYREDGTRRNGPLYCLLISVVIGVIGEFVVLGICFPNFATPVDASGVNCDRNNFFIWVAIIMTVISVLFSLPCASSQSSILVGGVVCFYTTYLLFVGLVADPELNCNHLAKDRNNIGYMIVGVLISAIALVYSAHWAAKTELTYEEREILAEEAEEATQEAHNAEMDGKPAPSKTKEELQTEIDNGDKADDEAMRKVSLRFHFIMFFASAYVAMLFTNWGSLGDTTSITSANNASVWVNVVSSWLVFLFYGIALFFRVKYPERFEDEAVELDGEEDV